jgi:hypothetical protein
MASINLKTTLAVSADQLWAEVKDVGGVSGMLEVIAESSLDGDQRSCTLADGGLLSETIMSVDDEHKRVAYTITESPFPIEAHAASMQVTDAGDGKSTFQWITDVLPDEMADGLGPMLAGEISNLEQRFGT